MHNATGGNCAFLGQNPVRDVPGQILGKAGDSRILRRNLKTPGVNAPASAHAHHIVPHTDGRAAPAREVLQRLGIDFNQADNGVYLPITGKRKSLPTANHGDTFGFDYFEELNLRITSAEVGGRSAVLDALSSIRTELLNGTFFD